jgi:hypothetical protein
MKNKLKILWFTTKRRAGFVIELIGLCLGAGVVIVWLSVSIILLLASSLLINRWMLTILTDYDFAKFKPMYK